MAKVIIPVTLDCLMTRAVNTRRTQTFVTGSSSKVNHGPLLSSLDLDGFRIAQRWWHS